MRKCEKYRTTRQARDDNMAFLHCTLDTKVFKHTLGISDTYCLSTAAMVERRPLDVTLYVECLSCSTINRIQIVLASNTIRPL